jgi:hypothetical protein
MCGQAITRSNSFDHEAMIDQRVLGRNAAMRLALSRLSRPACAIETVEARRSGSVRPVRTRAHRSQPV